MPGESEEKKTISNNIKHNITRKISNHLRTQSIPLEMFEIPDFNNPLSKNSFQLSLYFQLI